MQASLHVLSLRHSSEATWSDCLFRFLFICMFMRAFVFAHASVCTDVYLRARVSAGYELASVRNSVREEAGGWGCTFHILCIVCNTRKQETSAWSRNKKWTIVNARVNISVYRIVSNVLLMCLLLFLLTLVDEDELTMDLPRRLCYLNYLLVPTTTHTHSPSLLLLAVWIL